MPGPLNKSRLRGPGPDYVPKNLARRIKGFAEEGKSGFRKPGSQNRKK